MDCEIAKFDPKTFLTRVCRSCGVVAPQLPNGSYLCLKCDPLVSYGEFVRLVQSGFVSTVEVIHFREFDGTR